VRLGGAGVLPLLDHALRDGDVRVRLEAVRGLAAIRTEPALARLREVAASASGPLQTAAIAGLGASRDAGALPLLERLAESSEDPVRVAARDAIFAIRSGAP
jgi:HEAT repeat protein